MHATAKNPPTIEKIAKSRKTPLGLEKGIHHKWGCKGQYHDCRVEHENTAAEGRIDNGFTCVDLGD